MVLEKVKHANENGNLISELQTRQRRIINLAHQLCTVLTYESRYNFSDLCDPSFIMMGDDVNHQFYGSVGLHVSNRVIYSYH